MVIDKMKRLTQKQNLILEYIEYMLNLKGFPPTLKEIANFLGVKNTSTVYRHLKRIEKKKYLRLTGGVRGVNIIKPLRDGKLIPLYRDIPLTTGLTPLSLPETYEWIEVPEWIHKKLGRNPVAIVWQWNDYGDAMIRRGDILFISQELHEGFEGYALLYHPESGILVKYVKVNDTGLLLREQDTLILENPVFIGRVVLAFRDLSKI